MSNYTIPYVTERTPNGERSLDVYSRLLSDRIVYLGTEIDDGVANALIAQLLHLESDSPDLPINLYINSPGGSPSAMLAIYDTMQYMRARVTTTCVGQAAGPAAVLLAGGAKGMRSILGHGRVVLHQPSIEGQGTIPDLIIHADEVVRVRAQLEEVLAKHTGKDVATLRRDTDRDLILPAADAVEYGIVDEVMTTR
ncbi:ATP-dependent Clp protease proteolytic subunit [Gordonia araii NBRC 100433]|uniref:ATP-dependent Clp protease proteolytic subunit n=1 Tax=Gordonia araii NBRC 100433 TaxID=1073574 RepID=G7GYY7_9ACTN|nr:ATP-dependent Clp protease proteolytic subunit [Gordonia araii]NNG97022.1 ATP-dependent Clp protease proteolytic subunit [Gordonia araii NBRC 100433]GAB08812.1 ATP-dependent Clp protease proteolytic subunit [Gordonia araii NBRC 100433]